MPSCSSREQVLKLVPLLDGSDQARFPIEGGLWQGRGGTARHDAVAWGFARAADARGVDIIQNCEVTGFCRERRPDHRRRDHPRHDRAPAKVGLAVAGHTSQVAALAGLRLPIESHLLQACVIGALEALARHRGDLRRRPFLHQPVGQGRAGVRRRPRRLQFLRPARQSRDDRGRRELRPRACCPGCRACAWCATGAGSWT